MTEDEQTAISAERYSQRAEAYDKFGNCELPDPVPDHSRITHSRKRAVTGGHVRTQTPCRLSSGGPERCRQDTRGHSTKTVRDREAPSSNPGPPTTSSAAETTSRRPGEQLAPRLHPRAYDETTGWRQRQTRTDERLLMAVDELAAATRPDPSQIRSGVVEMQATSDWMSRRVLMVAERR